MMAATNANMQMLMQLLQERNQGNHGHGNFQNQFATLNQFLANQPMTFSNCVEETDADDWLVDICKHFECSNVRPEDFLSFVVELPRQMSLVSGLSRGANASMW